MAEGLAEVPGASLWEGQKQGGEKGWKSGDQIKGCFCNLSYNDSFAKDLMSFLCMSITVLDAITSLHLHYNPRVQILFSLLYR